MREKWVDVARGIGILCVVAGHWIGRDTFGYRVYACCNLLYAFHMPLFFFLSGFMCRRSFTKDTVATKLDSLIMPYLIYTPIILLIMGLSDSYNMATWLSGLRAFALFDGFYVTWFFPCLFASELIGIFLIGAVQDRRWQLFCAMGAAIIGVAVNTDCVRQYIPQVFKCRTVPMALAFWLCGYMLRCLCWSKPVIAFVFVASSAGLALRLDYRCNFAHAMIGNPVVFYLAALSGIVVTLIISRIVSENRILEWCGRNALLILVAHVMAMPISSLLGGGGDFV